ncbi:hypothetical protein HYPSUDRAFT_202457 [Hypholoma sublateritium FD-334 SS-4]|uniref:Uncharacterized protein n=1 Tax=Hypholoma sublateritium (strain FD-334 SS-4) TaxID=945553 RepID=A0A0D2MEE9_HYPSF|nr:hypothetical protein HYPSUDRAFT_202457 [Hypholoma sublateritium FD-334 SS-4]
MPETGIRTYSFTGIIEARRLLPSVHVYILRLGSSEPNHPQPLDLGYVSLVGTLKGTPRPGILEEVRRILDSQDEIEPKWKVSCERSDRTHQVYFEVDEGLNSLQIKGRIDNVLRQNHHDLQMSYILNNSNCIFYHFLNRHSITSRTDSPIRIENRSYLPHLSRFIQPLYGLEVAVNVGDVKAAKSMIDSYLQNTDIATRLAKLSFAEAPNSMGTSTALLKSPNISFATPSTSSSTWFSLVIAAGDTTCTLVPKSIANVNEQIDAAKKAKNLRTAELREPQSHALPMLPPAQIHAPTPHL